jgi:hypothetical protein
VQVHKAAETRAEWEACTSLSPEKDFEKGVARAAPFFLYGLTAARGRAIIIGQLKTLW